MPAVDDRMPVEVVGDTALARSASADYNGPLLDYHEFHGFKRPPFELTPDPGLLVLGSAHEEALDKLYRGILSGRGFLVLSGEVGTGKTLLLHTLMGLLDDSYQIAYIFHAQLGAEDLLELILAEFGISVAGSPTQASRLRLMSDFLISARRAGRKPLLIIDEAQNLKRDTLESLRLISNLETPEGKLIQFLLAGQPELTALLASPELRQLRQRIGVRQSLDGLSLVESWNYIRERCRMAGAERCPFNRDVVLRIFALTKGTPRLINSVCDALLMDTFLQGDTEITVEHLQQVRQAYDF